CQDKAQQDLQPGEDEAQVVADCGEDGVRGVAGTVLEVAAAEVAVGFHVSDHSLDGAGGFEIAMNICHGGRVIAMKIDRIQPAGMNVRIQQGKPAYSHVVTVTGPGKTIYAATIPAIAIGSRSCVAMTTPCGPPPSAGTGRASS